MGCCDDGKEDDEDGSCGEGWEIFPEVVASLQGENTRVGHVVGLM